MAVEVEVAAEVAVERWTLMLDLFLGRLRGGCLRTHRCVKRRADDKPVRGE